MGCRRPAPRHELVRVALRPDGFVVRDPTLGGRGAWLCAGSDRCLAEAIGRNAFARAFRTRIEGVLVTSEDLGTGPGTD